MHRPLILLKSLSVILIISSFTVISYINEIAFRKNPRKLQNAVNISSFFCRLLIYVLGVRVNLPENSGRIAERNYLIVSNHLSYLDIFILSSLYPSVFIASRDGVENMPLLGTIARLGGGIFVDRLSRINLKNEIDKISEVILSGFNVIIFPEATTSNGDRVLDFKSSLLSPAINSGISIKPLCIKYRRINGEEVGPENRDLIYYYGDAEFFEHFSRLISQNSIEVEIRELCEIDTSVVVSRKQATKIAYNSISIYFMS